MSSKLQRQHNKNQRMKSLANLGNRLDMVFHTHRNKDFKIITLPPYNMMRATKCHFKKNIQK